MLHLTMSHLKKAQRHLILQDESAECAHACLAMIARAHGAKFDLIELRRLFPTSSYGLTMDRLADMAAQIGLDSRGLRLSVEELRGLRLPAVLHWGLSHFVVLNAISGRNFIISDPASGSQVLGAASVSRLFSGVAMEFSQAEDFKQRRQPPKLALSGLWSRTSGLFRSLSTILVLAIVVQLYQLASPLFLQIAIDTILPSADVDLLTTLTIGFIIFTFFAAFATMLKGYAIAANSNEVGYGIASNLFSHMTWLQPVWFERRSVGDVLTRFNSVQPVADVISKSLSVVAIDAVLSVVCLGILAIYLPSLAIISIVGMAIYVGIRFSYFSTLRLQSIGVVRSQAAEQTNIIETIRSISAIKLFGRELNRIRSWQNKRVQVLNAQTKVARLQAIFDASSFLVLNLETIIFACIGIRSVISGDISVGMLIAASSYRQQFLTSAISVVSKFVEYKMLDVQLGRISDIALAEKERRPIGSIDGAAQVGALELRGVRFRHSATDSDLLKGVNLRVEAGASVAITGASGGGKTTLIKVMLGILRPTAGAVMIDGRTLESPMIPDYRRSIGTVMQDDMLLTGTIGENVCFFDDRPDQDWISEVCDISHIDKFIRRLPMGYDTIIGDLGVALSGGQKQRILLARALYKKPRILFLDEATSSLDINLEKSVAKAISELNITRVVIAHRRETIASCDDAFELKGGALCRRSSLPKKAGEPLVANSELET